jgi:hypothetical protein
MPKTIGQLKAEWEKLDDTAGILKKALQNAENVLGIVKRLGSDAYRASQSKSALETAVYYLKQDLEETQRYKQIVHEEIQRLEQEDLPRQIAEHGRLGKSAPTKGIIDAIRPGDTVIIRNRFGQQQRGKAVMRNSYGGWTLNMGGRYGTPGLADKDNIVKVIPSKRPHGG